MSTYNTLVSLFSIGVVLYCGMLVGDKEDLKDKVKERELTIVKLEDKIVEQQSEIKILVEDNTAKQTAIASLEERVISTSRASQEALDRLVELAKIEMDLYPAARTNDDHDQHATTQPPSSSISTEPPKETKVVEKQVPSTEKTDSKKKVNIVNEDTSKKFINLRNDIYSRYK